MKRISMVLPLAVLLAYCSGPNNTQTTAERDMDGTSGSVSASTTGTTTTDMTASSADVSSSTTSMDGTDAHKADIVASASSVNNNTSSYGSVSTETINMDTTDPMYQHFQKTNGQNWTWDLNYPGYDRPTAGTYNAAVNGNWQLVMTPELVSAWRDDNSRSLWNSGYAYDGRYLGGNTYLSASESFNTRNSSDLNGGTTDQNPTTTATTSGSVSSSTSSTSSGVNGTTGVSGSTDLTGTAGNMDVNSINYNAANGNMYQLPKFNLYLDNGSFTGYTGCNSVSGRVSVSGNSIHFLNTEPSTNIDCMGGLDQTVLLDLLRRVDSYSYVGDELQLMQGNQVLLRFKKGGAGTSLQ